MLLIFVLLTNTITAQYDFFKEQLDLPGITVGSIRAYTSVGEDYYCIINGLGSESYFIRVNSANQVYKIDEITVSPGEFAFIEDHLYYVEGQNIYKYNVLTGDEETISMHDYINENQELDGIILFENNIVVSYNLIIPYLDDTYEASDVGLIYLDYNTHELITIAVPTVDEIEREKITNLYLTEYGLAVVILGDDKSEFYDGLYSKIFDSQMNEVKSAYGKQWDPVDTYTYYYGNFTYYDSFMGFEVAYTPADAVVYSFSVQGCGSRFIDNYHPSWNSEFGYRIDSKFFMIQRGNKLKVYNCSFQHVNTYEDISRMSQNKNGLFSFKKMDGELHILRIGPSIECTNTSSISLSSQEEVDSYIGCQSILGDVTINDGLDGEYDISNLDSLGKLMCIEGNLDISDNPLLNTFDYFNGNLQISDTLIVNDNVNLSDCHVNFICNHIGSEKEFIYANNGENCSDFSTIFDNCSMLCPEGEVYIDNCFAASEFATNYPHCETIEGNLIIGEEFSESAIPIDFYWLSRITEVTKDVSIHKISVIGEAKLNFRKIGGSLSIIPESYNQDLTFPYLRSVGMNLTIDIEGNGNYSEYDLPVLNSIGGSLNIYNYGHYYFYNLKSLDSIYGKMIIESNIIKTLDELEDLKFIGDSIFILNNQHLHGCDIEVLCNRIGLNNQDVTIFGNLGTCKDTEAVSEDCFPVVATENEILELPFKAYPNPVHDLIHFELSQKEANVALLDFYGKVVWEESIDSDFYSHSTTNLASGIYIAKIQIDGISYYQKVVKK